MGFLRDQFAELREPNLLCNELYEAYSGGSGPENGFHIVREQGGYLLVYLHDYDDEKLKMVFVMLYDEDLRGDDERDDVERWQLVRAYDDDEILKAIQARK